MPTMPISQMPPKQENPQASFGGEEAENKKIKEASLLIKEAAKKLAAGWHYEKVIEDLYSNTLARNIDLDRIEFLSKVENFVNLKNKYENIIYVELTSQKIKHMKSVGVTDFKEHYPDAEKNSDKYGGDEKAENLWLRITKKAMGLLEKNPDFSLALKEKAQKLISDPLFRKKLEKTWKEQTFLGHVKSDPEKQEELWAGGLSRKIEYEIFKKK